jgi:hypothetical protein
MVMIEYSHRYSTLYYAAKAGNWPPAAYELKEALEIQEVGETTRPEKAEALKAFERSFLTPLDKTIKAKDFKRFEVHSRLASKVATVVIRLRGCRSSNISYRTARHRRWR